MLSPYIVKIPLSTRVLVPIRSLALAIAAELALAVLMMHDDHDGYFSTDINVRILTKSDSSMPQVFRRIICKCIV